jgi:hypothetical protein
MKLDAVVLTWKRRINSHQSKKKHPPTVSPDLHLIKLKQKKSLEARSRK